jgi:uncharacterized protein (TIGR02145 family)
MKKTIHILSVFFFALSLFAQQEPIMKFYINDESPKEYKISEIENFSFIHSNLSYKMIIFDKDDDLQTEFDIRDIDSIGFGNSTKMIISMNTDIIERNIFDIDSIIFIWNTCEEIQIGNQVWMCKNLDVDTYRNGEPIRHAETNAEWEDAYNKHEGAWCYYDNDSANGEIYGKLYNWYAVNDPRGLALEGWHVPTDEEWKELEMCLGMSQSEADGVNWRGTDEGSKLAGRADLWADGALNSHANFGTSGFSALPGGMRGDDGAFGNIGLFGNWWSASEYKASYSWIRSMFYNSSILYRTGYGSKEDGLSVRCVRD